jgi:hypothetical protein
LLPVLFYDLFSCFRPSCCCVFLLSFFHFTLSLLILFLPQTPGTSSSSHICFRQNSCTSLLACIRRVE